MTKHNELNEEVNQELSTIFFIMEKKFIEYAMPDDIIIIKPDLEHNTIISSLAKPEDTHFTEFSQQLVDELTPYFKYLRENFQPSVIHEFIFNNYQDNMYIKDFPTIATEHLIEKVKNPDYKPPKLK